MTREYHNSLKKLGNLLSENPKVLEYFFMLYDLQVKKANPGKFDSKLPFWEQDNNELFSKLKFYDKITLN